METPLEAPKVAVLTSITLAPDLIGGVDEWLRTLFLCLGEGGITADLLNLNPQPSPTPYIPITSCPVDNALPNEWLKNQIERAGYTHLVIHNYHEARMLPPRHLTSLKRVLMLHGHPEFEFAFWSAGWRKTLGSWLIRRTLRRALRLADIIVTPSGWLANYLRTLHPSGKYWVIPYAIPEKVTRFGAPPPAQSMRIGVINSLSAPYRWQDFELLCLTLEKLLPKHPQITVDVVGGQHDSKYFLAARKRASQFGGALRLHGKMQNPWEILKDVSLFFHPSHLDSFSIATLEAMTLGKACLVSATGGIPELVGDTALVVENQPEAMAAALEKLFSQPQLTSTLGLAAQQRATAYFSRTNFAKSWRDLLS